MTAITIRTGRGGGTYARSMPHGSNMGIELSSRDDEAEHGLGRANTGRQLFVNGNGETRSHVHRGRSLSREQGWATRGRRKSVTSGDDGNSSEELILDPTPNIMKTVVIEMKSEDGR